MAKIRVLVVSPFIATGNSFYRAAGPWGYTAKRSRVLGGDPEIEVEFAGNGVGFQEIRWVEAGHFDLVFLHQPQTPQMLNVLRIARNMNVPVWVDFDDDIFNIPQWNPAYPVFQNPANRSNTAACIALADIVTAPTQVLVEKWGRANPHAVLVPNAYRNDLYWYRNRELPKRCGEIAWRGAPGHDGDLESVAPWPPFKMKTNFFGQIPWSLKAGMFETQFRITPPQDPFQYFKALHQAAPNVLVVPLADHPFNYAKSNIAYQEALHAGAICVAPNLPEWTRPGIMNYQIGSWESFAEIVEKACAVSPEAHAEIVGYAFEHMLSLYSAETVDNIRRALLISTQSSDFQRNPRDAWDPLLPMWALGRITGASPEEAKHGQEKKQPVAG